MEQSQIAQLESMCEKLYTSSDPNERGTIDKALLPFSSSMSHISLLKLILDRSNSPYAQHFAASSLTRLITSHWNDFTVPVRLEIRNHMLALLANKGPKIAPFVITTIVQLTTRICKLAWFDDPSHQEIVEEILKFLKHSGSYYFIGLKLFNQLVLEMNEITPGQILNQHRKIANSFRDKCLLQIFKVALQSLTELYQSTTVEMQDKLKEEALELAYKCLSFDFIGTFPEDSQEDVGTVQVPSSWKSLFDEDGTIKLILSIYENSKPPLSTVALKCFVQIASIRRSLFHGEVERGLFLRKIMDGIKDILRSRSGLNEQANHHEFCRLLARLKGNYQLNQILSVEGYLEWISQIAVFTVNSFSLWQWSPNSVYYLLTFWSRLVVSMTYLKKESATLLDPFAPQLKIFNAYVASRMESVQVMVQNDSDENLLDEDEEQLIEQLEALPHLGRWKYDMTRSYLISLFDPLAQAFRKFLEQSGSGSMKEFKTIEGKLTVLVYTIGSIVGGRTLANNTEEHDLFDGELTSRVFELMRLHDAGLSTTPNTATKVGLELALLGFLDQFRRAYIGDQARASMKVYEKLSELLRINSEQMVLDLMVNKIATTLKYWEKEEKIVDKTLTVLEELASGYSSSKYLVKLETTNQFLAHHTSQFFPFMEHDCNLPKRTTYYQALARLLFMEDNISKFESFMEPFKNTLRILAEQNRIEFFRTDNCKKCIIGVFRDLRGIAFACASRRSYSLLFDFLYPEHFPVFLRTVEALYDCSDVMISLLSFLAEFVYNKGARITFDTSSVNGILLFKETSKLLLAYGSRLLTLTAQPENLYKEKYKPISLCLTTLTHALVGSYVNFGVFSLYRDSALSDALDICLKLAFCIPLKDTLTYPKLVKSFYSLLDILCNNHISTVATLDSQSFLQVILALKEGLDSLCMSFHSVLQYSLITALSVVSQCCLAIDRIATYSMSNVSKEREQINAMKNHVTSHSELFLSIMTVLLKKTLYEDVQNQWSLSRPLFSLMLLNPQHFTHLKNQVISVQPTEMAKQKLMKDFDSILLKDLQFTLELSSRDKFSQNLNLFLDEVKKYICS